MDLDAKLPPLRPLDIIPVTDERGAQRFALRDAAGIAPEMVLITPAGYFAAAQLDGTHSIRDIQTAFLERTGVRLDPEQVAALVNALDEGLLLANERFAAALAALTAEYRAAPARDNTDRYPDGQTLRAELDELLGPDGTPGMAANSRGHATAPAATASGATAPAAAPLHGVIAPHLDYPRGAPCYRAAYAALRAAGPAERYVILGTNHAGQSRSVVATTKDFQTPLGVATTDRAFTAELERRTRHALCIHELDHLHEHSVELQVHLLQALWPGQPLRIVPLLCPDPCGPTGTAPSDGTGPDLGEFADVLGQMLAETDGRTVVIAGADLSHVGQRFGEPAPSTPEFMEAVASVDQMLLELLAAREEEQFLRELAAAENRTRVCSAGCIYTLLRALPGHACELLHYHQAVNYEEETHVTCAALAVR